MKLTVTYAQPRIGTWWIDIKLGVAYQEIRINAATVTELKHRALADAVAVVDQVFIDFGKSLADSVDVADAIQSFEFGKALIDSITMADNFDRVAEFTREFADTVTVDDAIAKSFVKVLADSVTVTDEINVNSQNQFNDTVSVADAIAMAIGKALADTVTVADAGLIVMQDYIAHDYFAEDYVGQSRAF